MSLRLALWRVLCAPLGEDPPRNRIGWRAWLWLHERRYSEAEKRWGRERAKVYDYIPF